MTATIMLKNQFSNVNPGDVGIIGDPIEHSLSPIMQNAAFKTWEAAFRDSEHPSPRYHRFLVKHDELDEAIHLMKEHRMRGLNVTIPHKVAACKFVDTLSPFASKVGAINTLSFSGQSLSGYNTDADGFKRALAWDLDYDATGKTVLILGAGGTGRVLAYSLLDLAVEKIYIWNRDPKRLEGAFSLDGDGNKISPVESPIEVHQLIKECDLIVNATSVGLKEKDGLPLEGLRFSAQQAVFDVIYHRETKFLAEAKLAGAKTAGGLGMLVYQGAKSFEIWTGKPAPVDLMRETVTQAMRTSKTL